MNPPETQPIYGLGLVLGLLAASGAMCPKCGHGTRATSKKWARCKKCGERVERVKMQDIKIKAVPARTPNEKGRLRREGQA